MSDQHDPLTGRKPVSEATSPDARLLLDNPKRIRSEQDVDLVLSVLPALSIRELRTIFRRVHGIAPPPVFGRNLLKRAIAYRVQEQVFGGLSRETKKLLDRLADPSRRSGTEVVVPRRIKPGSVIVREWRGTSHQVVVLSDGFQWNGETYASLSEIARLITGTRWNGPRFFGLRTQPKSARQQGRSAAGPRAAGQVEDESGGLPSPPRRRGRPRKSTPGVSRARASEETEHAL
jgi:hypothetical protein